MSSPEFDETAAQRDEWRRQELALQAERHTAAHSPEMRRDTDLAKYRLIDRALRAEHAGLPDNFAAQTAEFVEAASRAAGDRLESWLQRAMIAALVVAAIVTFVLIGRPALAVVASLPGTGWAYTIALCIGLSLGMQHFAQRWTKST